MRYTIRIIKYKVLLRLYLLALLLIIINIGCEDNPAASGQPVIESISHQSTFAGDTISIYGKNFSSPSAGSAVVFDDSIEVISPDCIKWTEKIIRLIVPAGVIEGRVFVRIGKINSNILSINIDKLHLFELVEITAGSFLMGSNIGMEDEKPARDVTISRNFYITKYEITKLQFKSVMGSVPGGYTANDFPADSISWRMAVEFCNSLSLIRGYDAYYYINGDTVSAIDTANGWRLPTEAEWEYAARAGSDKDFSGTGDLNDMGWYDANSGFKPHLVGQKAANQFGLYDIHGNVWEWCWDYYSADYYSAGENDDPQGPAAGLRRVARGGAWNSGNSLARSPNRTYDESFIGATGFRIVRNVETD